MSQSYFILGFMIESANLEWPFPPPTHIWCMLTYATFMIESAHSEWPFPPPTPIDWSDEDAYLKLKALHEQVYMHKQRVHKKIHEWLCERDSVYAHAHTGEHTPKPPRSAPPIPPTRSALLSNSPKELFFRVFWYHKGGWFCEDRMLTYADVCWRMLTHADVFCRVFRYHKCGWFCQHRRHMMSYLISYLIRAKLGICRVFWSTPTTISVTTCLGRLPSSQLDDDVLIEP